MKKTTPVFLIIIAALFVSVLYLLYLNFNKTPTTSIAPETGIIPTEKVIPTIIDETADWKTYSDNISEITFKYPPKFSIGMQFQDSGNGVSYIFAPDHQISLSIQNKYSATDASYFMNTTSNGQIKIANNLWKTYFVPNGYPEGTVGSGDPIFALQTEINKKLVIFTLFNQSNITDEQFKILSSFKFIDATTSSISSEDLAQGWYWGSENQKMENTPTNWLFKENGRSSCWHDPSKKCEFLPLPD